MLMPLNAPKLANSPTGGRREVRLIRDFPHQREQHPVVEEGRVVAAQLAAVVSDTTCSPLLAHVHTTTQQHLTKTVISWLGLDDNFTAG